MARLRYLSMTACAALIASSVLVAPLDATPSNGFAPNPIGSGNVGTLNINTAGDKTGKWGLHLKTLSSTDVSADRLVVQESGFSGWHAHPGPVLVVVTQGSITWYDGSNPLCTPRTYTVGQAFIEPPFAVHNVLNASASVDAEYLAFTIKPQGVAGPAFRLDRPQPTNCAF